MILNVLQNIKQVKSHQKKNELNLPFKYAVIMHNDNITTMRFVVKVLQRFFGHNERAALEIMLRIHHKGQGICGIYTAEIAEMKIIKVLHYARQYHFPLRCTMEKISG